MVKRIYAKSFHGATVKCMKSYVQPFLKCESDLYILHVGTNDLRSEKSAQSIAHEIINLSLDMKKDTNNVIILSILTRGDKLHEKGRDTDDYLHPLCIRNNLAYFDNSNITTDYLNNSGPPRRLLGKLISYGVTGNILSWIQAFLNERSQIVKVNSTGSMSAPVLSGVPQGSVLGPILFIVYINDLLERIQSNVLLFADDAKIFNQTLSREDALTVQSDLNSLEDWSRIWLLNFNCDKCHVLRLGKLDSIRYTHRYTIYQSELEHVFEERDLGVTINMDLNFEEHISSKVKKANPIMGLIRRSFSFLDCHLFKKLCETTS